MEPKYSNEELFFKVIIGTLKIEIILNPNQFQRSQVCNEAKSLMVHR